MRIGIDASRAFDQNRTGIEEYSYQVIKHLTDKLNSHQVVLYIRNNQRINFKLPDNWKLKVVYFPYLWTQIGLSIELLFHPVDNLLIPAHTVPIIHPKNTVVAVHGLEYEFCPRAYSLWERLYMRWSIKNSCRWAKKIIAVSNNTKKDLVELYKISEDKIKVVYEGVSLCHSELVSESRENMEKILKQVQDDKYFLFIGRLEERKNINGIVEAFEILKEKYKIPHKLVLAGKGGHGYEDIKNKILKSKNKETIILPGFVADEEKEKYIKNADVFLFPSFYEGFGLPILEAQNVGVPVVTSNVSSMPEAAGNAALLVNPKKPEEIAEATFRLINDKNLRDDIINKGLENVKRFSWEKCAREISELILCQKRI